MIACRIHAKEDLRIEPADTPEAGPGQVLLRLGAGGICGSDLHYYFEGRNGSFVVREPLIPGHEASGIVAGIGAGVTRVKIGDHVAVSPSHACGQCHYCREGREQLCRRMRFLGSASLLTAFQAIHFHRRTNLFGTSGIWLVAMTALVVTCVVMVVTRARLWRQVNSSTEADGIAAIKRAAKWVPLEITVGAVVSLMAALSAFLAARNAP